MLCCTCYATQFLIWVRMEKKTKQRHLSSNSAWCREKEGDENISLTTHWSTVHRPQSFHWQKVDTGQEQCPLVKSVFPLVKSLSAAAWSSLQHCRPVCWTPPFAASWQAATYPHQPNHWYFHSLLPKQSDFQPINWALSQSCVCLLWHSQTERFTWHTNMVFHTTDVILGLGWEVLPFSCSSCISLPPRHCFILYFHLL